MVKFCGLRASLRHSAAFAVLVKDTGHQILETAVLLLTLSYFAEPGLRQRLHRILIRAELLLIVGRHTAIAKNERSFGGKIHVLVTIIDYKLGHTSLRGA